MSILADPAIAPARLVNSHRRLPRTAGRWSCTTEAESFDVADQEVMPVAECGNRFGQALPETTSPFPTFA
jgi:hypothetical protein